MSRRIALVTGASRGIGKATAVDLARNGFDVAITARSVHEGTPRLYASSVKDAELTTLPGSLQETARLITEQGAEALMVPADLDDFASLEATASTVLEQWGHVDVIVNSARYLGPGHMDLFLDTPIELIDAQLRGNVLAPLVLLKALLPSMIERRTGTFVHIDAVAAYADITAPAGKGGYGLGYGVSKAAAHRVAGFLAAEHGDAGIRAFNVQPGLVATERRSVIAGRYGHTSRGAPVEAIARTITWLLTSPDADQLPNASTIEAQFLCHELGLLPDWDGPQPNTAAVAYDLSGANLAALEQRLTSRPMHHSG